MLKILLRSSALILLVGTVFSPLKAMQTESSGEDKNTLGAKSRSFKKKEAEENEEKELSLFNSLNLGFDMDEKTGLPKEWNLVDSAKTQGIKKPLSLKKHPKWIELLGDDYTFYTNVPALRDFANTTFLFSVALRSTNPGAFIQYYDGKNVVNSVPYASKRGEWETLNIEFTIDANAKFHRLYSAILGAVKNNDKPSVDISSIKLQQKPVVEMAPVAPVVYARSKVEVKVGVPTAAELEYENFLHTISQRVRAHTPLIINVVEPILNLIKGPHDLPLKNALSKRLKAQIEEWDTPEGTELSFFQKIERAANPSETQEYKELIKSINSFKRMVISALENPGIPLLEDLPAHLRVNSWKVNDPYLDLVKEKMNHQNEDQPFDDNKYNKATVNLLTLQKRLRQQGKLKDANLVDYVAIPEKILNHYTQNAADYEGLADYLKKVHDSAYIATDHNFKFLITSPGSLYKKPEYSHLKRMSHKIITLSSIIWDSNNNQILSDEVLLPIIERLTRAGKHCDAHREEDFSWAIRKLLTQGRQELEDQGLELKVAFLMSLINEKIVDEIVNDERSYGEKFAYSLSHVTPRVKQKLAYKVGFQGNPEGFVDTSGVGENYSRMPVKTFFDKYQAKVTPERLIEEFTNDINTSHRRIPLSAISLTTSERAGRSPEEIRKLKESKFNAQPKSVLQHSDIVNYIERVDPTINIGEFSKLDENTYETTIPKEQVARLLFSLGYLEKND